MVCRPGLPLEDPSGVVSGARTAVASRSASSCPAAGSRRPPALAFDSEARRLSQSPRRRGLAVPAFCDTRGQRTRPAEAQLHLAATLYRTSSTNADVFRRELAEPARASRELGRRRPRSRQRSLAGVPSQPRVAGRPATPARHAARAHFLAGAGNRHRGRGPACLRNPSGSIPYRPRRSCCAHQKSGTAKLSLERHSKRCETGSGERRSEALRPTLLTQGQFEPDSSTRSPLGRCHGARLELPAARSPARLAGSCPGICRVPRLRGRGLSGSE